MSLMDVLFRRELLSPLASGELVDPRPRTAPPVEVQSTMIPTAQPRNVVVPNNELLAMNAISQAFPEKTRQSALRVLRHQTPSGEIKGENTQFQTGPEVDIPNKNGTIDRGLFRINSATFSDFMARKANKLKRMDITSYDDMYDPVKNAKMAKIIYDEQGWNAWYAAPNDLKK